MSHTPVPKFSARWHYHRRVTSQMSLPARYDVTDAQHVTHVAHARARGREIAAFRVVWAKSQGHLGRAKGLEVGLGGEGSYGALDP